MKDEKPLRIKKTSLERRNLTRHSMPPPSFSFTDKKKRENLNKCRKAPRIRDGE